MVGAEQLKSAAFSLLPLLRGAFTFQLTLLTPTTMSPSTTPAMFATPPTHTAATRSPGNPFSAAGDPACPGLSCFRFRPGLLVRLLGFSSCAQASRRCVCVCVCVG